MEQLDCLFIGHNEMEFTQYEKNIKKLGVNSGAYRDLNLSYVWYDNKPYTVSDIFNLFYSAGGPAGRDTASFTMGETFSAAISYLGTFLDRRGYTFDFVNSFQEEKKALAEKLSRCSFRSIAITTTLYVSPLPIIEIIDFIKQYDQTAKIIIGGPFISTQYRTQARTAIDYLLGSVLGADIYVNSSQGEATLVKILAALKTGLPLDDIPNLYFKTDNGYITTPIVVENNPLAQNMVNWDLFSHRDLKFPNLRTAISCPFACSFCGFPEHAGEYQYTPVEEIEGELKQLAALNKTKCVHFIDDTFNVPVKRFKDILRMMIRNKFDFTWYSHYRCQFADRETIRLMKESKCQGVFLGIESGSDTILKNMNKAASVEKLMAGVKLLKEHGILTYGSFIIGFPGETEETVKETLRFITESGLDFYRVQLWYYEHITPIFKAREKYRIQGEGFEWSHTTMNVNQALDIIDDIFLTVKDPVWVPQYNFEFDALFHLLEYRVNIDELKLFLESFNNGVREKLLHPTQKEISYDVIKQIQHSLRRETGIENSSGTQSANVQELDAEFDF